MLHFHCRKCAKNILTEDGKDKPTFTDAACDACNPGKVVEKEIAENKDDIIANLEAQIALLSKKEEEPPLYVSDKPPKERKKKKT